MYAEAVLKTHVDTPVVVDLDSCAEINVVDISFVRRHRLAQVDADSPRVRCLNKLFTKVYGIYAVPISLTDNHGTIRCFTVSCLAIDRGEGDAPVLFGMPALSMFGILLFPQAAHWWFVTETDQIRLQNPKKFLKLCHQEARVYALIIHPDVPSELFPDEEEDTTPTAKRKEDEIPPELADFADVMDIHNADVLPSFKNTDHAIVLKPDTTPPVGPIYPLSRRELSILEEYLRENMAKGRIRASQSPAASPVLFVPKKDGTLRLCVDYRGLNKITVKNRYPLPLISEILDRASGANYFSKLDVKDAYYRIRIKEGDEWKTAFRTRYGLFEYLVMPFGLTNAPATFQNYIHQALGGLLDEFCVAYLDDILIFSPDRETHTKHIRQVLERLRNAQLYCKPSKCSFYKDQVDFLGYVVNRDGITMEPARVQTIQEWPEPQTFRDIQVFLGFCNFYRRFIRDYSTLARPLTRLLTGMEKGRKVGDIRLDHDQRAAFERLKAAFQEAPLLQHFDPEKAIIIETDASDFAMGAVLSQIAKDGRKHPVAFWSAQFSGSAKNYGTPDKEMMAIVEAFKHWRHYVEGNSHEITVLSDHNNLQGFMKQQHLNGRQARWCMYLSGFDFTIKHQPGKRNPADGPSRRPDYEDKSPSDRMEWMPTLQSKMAQAESLEEQLKCESGENRPVVTVQSLQVKTESSRDMDYSDWIGRKATVLRKHVAQLLAMDKVLTPEPSESIVELVLKLQETDPQTQKIKERLQSSRRNTADSSAWSLGDLRELRYNNKLFVPAEEAVKQELMRRHHDDPMAGHFGPERTLELLQRKFHWSNMNKDVKDHCRTCHTCQVSKPRRHQPYGSLESLPIPTRPWEEISMDFIVGFPAVIAKDGTEKDAILVVVDRYTKMNRFFAVNCTITSQELAELIHQEIELKYGIPNGCVSDRGSVFTSQFWSDLCYINRVHRRLSTAFHPQTDGQTERSNQTLIQYLRCFAAQEPVIWATILGEAEFVCNNAINATTHISPFKALMGYNPTISRRIGDDALQRRVHPNAIERIQKLETLREDLERHWTEAVENQKRYYDGRHKEKTFKKGDLVLLSTRNLKLKTPKKMTPKFVGPFRVLDTVGSLAYRLALPEQYSRLHNVFPVVLLEPWYARSQEEKGQMPMPDLEDDDEWEVEEVRDEKRFDDELFFLVKWKGWPSEFNQWVGEEDIQNAWKLVLKYRQEVAKGRPSANKRKRNPDD